MEISGYLSLGVPIPVEGLGTIHQPTLEEIMKKYENTDDLFFPYIIGKDLYKDCFTEEMFSTVKDFDLFFLINNEGKPLIEGKKTKYLITDLLLSLKLFFDTEDIKLVYEDELILINNEYKLTRYNYDKLCKIILVIGMKEKVKLKKEKLPKSKRLRELNAKLEKHRAETLKRNAPLLSDYVNTLVNNPVRGFSHEEVRKMTI